MNLFKNFKKTKSYLASFLAFLVIFSSCNGEELFQQEETIVYTNLSYKEIISNLKSKIDLVISESKPDDITLDEYKIKVLNGELKISKKQENKILAYSEKLSDYGKYLAKNNNIDIDVTDISSTIALGGLYAPEDNIKTKYIKIKQEGNLQLKMNPLLECGIIAIGADALWALGGSSASAWTAAAMTRAFSTIAKRFLGPVGVAIAVVTFGVCMASQDFS